MLKGNVIYKLMYLFNQSRRSEVTLESGSVESDVCKRLYSINKRKGLGNKDKTVDMVQTKGVFYTDSELGNMDIYTGRNLSLTQKHLH